MNICYTHKSCPDGQAAAWIVKRLYPRCKLVQLSHHCNFYRLLSRGWSGVKHTRKC